MLFPRVSLFWFFVFQKYNTSYELKPVVFSSSCSYSVCIIMVMARLKNGIIGVKSLKPFPGYFSGAPRSSPGWKGFHGNKWNPSVCPSWAWGTYNVFSINKNGSGGNDVFVSIKLAEGEKGKRSSMLWMISQS